MNHYQLMNKDTVILDFSCVRDDFDEPIFVKIEQKSEKLPVGFTNISSFLERRKAPKHREHIHALLAKYGCDDIEGFIRVTHAASLNDTFWVREENSTLTWKDVSLYQNDFNELISLAAFEGIISDETLSPTSPEFTTDGSYAKCWVREENGIFLYKAGSKYHDIEPLSEFLATQVSTIICANSVTYDLAYHNDKFISKCALFTDETYGFAPMSKIFKEKVLVSDLLAFFEEIGCGDDFRRMCVLDALISNIDRHFGNFGVIFNNETMEIQKMAPVFDNNRSLFFDVDENSMADLSYYARNNTPRLGTDFNVLAAQLLTPEIRSDLKNLSGFKFDQHPKFPASKVRLDALSRFVNAQIDLILNRIPVRDAAQAGKYNFESLDSKIEMAKTGAPGTGEDFVCTRKSPER